MSVAQIQVYDALDTKKIITVPVQESTLVQEICVQVDPAFQKQDKTLFLDDLELLWDWNIEYLEKHHHLKNDQKLALLVRTYDLKQTCRVLQLEEEEVKELIANKKAKAFMRGGQLNFRKIDVNKLRDSMMDCPTMLIDNPQEKLEAMLNDFDKKNLLLKIFDSTNGTSQEVAYDPSKTIGEYCLEVNPQSEIEDITLYQEKVELDWKRLVSDLIESDEVSLEKKFVLKVRFYTKEQVLQKLGISEATLKRMVQSRELRAFSKKGEWVFKKRDIDSN
ncbi:MAG: helix-turn-helix domain-containing protein [Planctomycetota bacterium]